MPGSEDADLYELGTKTTNERIEGYILYLFMDDEIFRFQKKSCFSLFFSETIMLLT